MLHTRSDRAEFEMQTPAALRAEVARVKEEVLEYLWQSKYRGSKRTGKRALEDAICTLPAILDSILNSLEQRQFIKGAHGTSGIKLTPDGEVEVEKLQPAEVVEATGEEEPPNPAKSDEHDLFISHASEDKDAFVRPLAEALRKAGLDVWYDEFSLRLGDSLRESIDSGLRAARHGLVVLSHHFFAKEWPKRELNALFATMKAGKRRILPVWHGLSAEDVQGYSPLAADLVAVNSAEGLGAVVKKVLDALNEQATQATEKSKSSNAPESPKELEPLREQVLLATTEHPGSTAEEVAAKVKVGVQLVQHHLEQLEHLKFARVAHIQGSEWDGTPHRVEWSCDKAGREYLVSRSLLK